MATAKAKAKPKGKAKAEESPEPAPVKRRTDAQILTEAAMTGGKITRSHVAELMINATEEARKFEKRFSKSEAGDMLAESLKFVDVVKLKSAFGHIGTPSRRVISIFLGLPETYFVARSTASKFSDYRYKRFTAIVPLKNTNSHSYKLHEVYALFEDGSREGMVDPAGHRGNTFNDEEGKYRLATDEEIHAFAKKTTWNLKIAMTV